MFRRKRKTAVVRDALGGMAPLAEEVVEDEKLRRRLGTAVAHGLAARREARIRGPFRQLASNGELLAQLGMMVGQLEAANRRRSRKRRNGKLVQSAFFAVPVAAVAVPQRRPWLKERLGGATDATGSLAGGSGCPSRPVGPRWSCRP